MVKWNSIVYRESATHLKKCFQISKLLDFLLSTYSTASDIEIFLQQRNFCVRRRHRQIIAPASWVIAMMAQVEIRRFIKF